MAVILIAEKGRSRYHFVNVAKKNKMEKMEPDSLPTELILTHPRESLGKIQLDWVPQPGNYVDVKGKTYAVLERHHHYQYKVGGYCLSKISLFVQSAQRPTERSMIGDRWVLGDSSCRFNARSEILRCAVNPEGPCAGCRYYETILPTEDSVS